MSFGLHTYVTGEVVTASTLNTYSRDDLRYLHGDDGPTTILDALTVGNGNLAGSYLQLPSMTTANLPGSPAAGMGAYDSTVAAFKDYAGSFGGFWSPRLQLLKQNSGNNAATGATVLDSVAMASGLLAGDKLLVHVSLEQITQTQGGFQLRNTTDSVNLESGASTGMAANSVGSGLYIIGRSPRLATVIITHSLRASSTGNQTQAESATFTTAWNGAWTLGLYEPSQTAGGTTYWHWQVWRLPAL